MVVTLQRRTEKPMADMQNWPLVIPSILDHAMREHPDRAIVTRAVEGGLRRCDYRTLHARARRVANALQGCGIRSGDRIATLAWNTDRHMEIWYGVMGLGAVCHTVNPRLFPEQIAYIINHAGDRLIFTDTTFLPLIEKLRPHLPTVESIIVLCDRSDLPDTALNVHAYEDWLADVNDAFTWASFSEESPAGLCYTSGTTGSPKGVLYSHRSNVLHALAMNHADGLAIRSRDVVMPIVPMFHANAWALVFIAPMAGAQLVLPGAALDGASLWELLEKERVTVAAAVPTLWLGLMQHLDATGAKLPHLDRVVIGGSAVPRMLVERFERDYQVEVIHAWGMTEMSPIGTFCTPKWQDWSADPEERMRRKLKQGRAPYTVEMKVVDDSGIELPRDGVARGNLLVRGPAIVERYHRSEIRACDEAGWFATGDVATVDPEGYMQIVDRSKDVIKSGGEWISSIELENAAVGHPDVAEAAVIGIPHEKWGERPLLIVVPKPGMPLDPSSILDYLADKVAKWWLPERVELVAEIPHTASGKIQKQQLRERFANAGSSHRGSRVEQP
jgi:fatty-acyl-CoA synthase